MEKNRASIVLFCLLITVACTEDPVLPEETAASDTDLKTKATATITGLTRYKISDLRIPSGGLPDGKRFYLDGRLRASTAYNPYGITQVVKNGYPRMRFYINPTTPSSYLVGQQYPYHHRAEFTRYPWRISHPLGTEEWLGFSYIFPTEAEGFKQSQTPVSIYQNHAGSVEGQTSNPPALQLEIAYPKQLNSTNPYFNTPLGGEIMIINKIRNFRFVAQGVRVTPGARLNIVIQIIYGEGSKGLFNVWINGILQKFPGKDNIAAGNIGSTVWPSLTTSPPVGGNSKLGLYHHQLRYSKYVQLNASYGHKKMEMFMTDWNEVIRYPSAWDYKNFNAYYAVRTAGYP